MGGTAGWLEVVLFVLGLGCLGLEIFVIPGFGVFGVSGILLVLCSLVMAGHSWTYDFVTNIEELTWQTGQIMLAFAIVFAIGLAITKFLPSLPGFDSMVLGPPGLAIDEPRLRGGNSSGTVGSGQLVTVGEKGIALTILRPAGKARIENRLFDVVSEGPFISADANLEVVSVSGNRIVVREA